jgi:hypothetical protein
VLAAKVGDTLSLDFDGTRESIANSEPVLESVGRAMNSVSVLKTGTLEPNASDPQSRNQDGAKPDGRPISLLAVLKAENMRLRQAVVELSLDVLAVREALEQS